MVSNCLQRRYKQSAACQLHAMRKTISCNQNQRQSSGSERHLPPRSLRTRSNTPRQAKRPRDVLAAAHHGALVIGPVGAELVLVIAGCLGRRGGRRDRPSGRGAHHGASRSSGPGGAVESSRDRRHAPLIRTACRSRTASTAIRPSVVYSTFASRSSASGAALSRRPSLMRRAASAATTSRSDRASIGW